MAARIIILTGGRSVGKTTVCHKTVTLAQAQGYACGGVITSSYADDVRDVLDVGSGHTRRLTVDAASAVVQGRFRFDPETLAWGNDVLARTTACHLLVVDELGPLEIERGQGWQKAFDVLRGNNFALAVVVVRPELLEQIQHKLPADSTKIFTVETHNRNTLPRVLLEMLRDNALS
jgi:nucleoside-triphosphatase THEP1